LLIIPQIETEFSIRNEVIATRQRIDAVNQNIAFLSSQNTVLLSSQVNTLAAALPTVKNFGPITGALNYASEVSGVSLGDYAFQMGQFAGSGASSTQLTSVTLDVLGKPENVSSFLHALYRLVPLVGITYVTGTADSAEITLQFYASTYTPVSISDELPINPLSSSLNSLMQELSSWQATAVPAFAPLGSSRRNVPLF
jgi:hypothetical protein